jgi:hypothetical protein
LCNSSFQDADIPCQDIEAHLEALIDSPVISTEVKGTQHRKSHQRHAHKHSGAARNRACKASIVDSHGDNENGISRKGTGFVHLQPEQRARIDDPHGDNENGIFRKGTGFVRLPSTKHAVIDDPHGDNENGIFRKGTGFVHLSSKQRVAIDDPHGDNENGLFRKGTGYVNLPLKKKATINDSHGDNENSIFRKGTGFVHLPGKVRPVIDDPHGDNENGILRKGTGYVHFRSLPRDKPSVQFSEDVQDGENHIIRKGTGYVCFAHVSPRVRIADAHDCNESKPRRKGTGPINLHDNELLPATPSTCSVGSVDEDEDEFSSPDSFPEEVSNSPVMQTSS